MAARLRAAAVLVGDQQALERPEQADREAEHQRNPDDGVQPVGRMEGELDDQRQAECHRGEQHEHDRTLLFVFPDEAG